MAGVSSTTSTSNRALEVGLSRRDRRRIERRDDHIREALAVGLPWGDILLGPGHKYYWDLLMAGAEEARRRFGRAADGLIDVQEWHAKIEQEAARERRERLGAEELWSWALLLEYALRDADWSRLLRTADVEWTDVREHIGPARTAALAAADYLDREIRRPAGDEKSSSLEWGWSPKTLKRFRENMRALERRLIWRLLQGSTFEDLLPVLDEMRTRALGDRLATMQARGDVRLSAAEEAAPSLSGYRGRN